LLHFCCVCSASFYKGEPFMKRFLTSKLVMGLVTMVFLAGAILVPLSGSLTHSHAQGGATATISPPDGPPGTQVIGTGSSFPPGATINVEVGSGTIATT